ncbi:DEAD/DEAH box helicase [bacterium]|nr:DEAD/DEAH box helicase [bacterium]
MGRRYNTHKRYNRKRSYRPSYPRKYGGKKIPTDKYIAKAEAGYIAPSIYVEDKSYEDFNISNTTLKQNIARKGYKYPTKIQDQAIPLILQGKDILGLASTGSGKTGAFLIPLIDKILKDRSQKCLIIVPTRELAAQIQDEFRELAQGTNIYSTLVIGGTRINKQINQLRRNPEFVMGTPGRLKDLFERGVLDLGKFNNIVLDEVDRMLDMGFIPDITFLISKLRDKKQTLFFSATMTREAERIGNTLLNNPIRIQVEKESPLKNIDQDIVRVKNPADKVKTLEGLLDKDEFTKVLVFSRTKRGADKLSKQLFERGFRADAIHGDKSQNKRLAVMKKFKTDQLDILVATDVAARGIDIPNVSHVINYDEPENYKDYIHRIGRTGRAGKTGCALTFVR